MSTLQLKEVRSDHIDIIPETVGERPLHLLLAAPAAVVVRKGPLSNQLLLLFPAFADVGVPQKLLLLVAVFVSYQRLDVADGLEGTGLVTNQFHPVGSILQSGIIAYTVCT